MPFCPRLCLARQNGQQTGISLLERKRWWLTAGDLRIFPSFSWFGKCDSRERSESERRRSVIPIREADRGRSHATFADAHSFGFAYAVRFSRRIADGSPGKKATFADAHSFGFAYAVRFSRRIADGSPGRMAMFPGFSRSGKCTAWRYTARFGVQVSGESRVSGMFSPETYCCSFLIYCDGILMSLIVEFLIYFFKKSTVCS